MWTQLPMTSKVETIIFSLLTVALLDSGEVHAQIAVVVNAENPTDSLSTVELRRIYLFETRAWRFDGKGEVKITVTDYNRKTVVLENFYRSVTGLTPSRVRLMWMGKLLNGALQTLPVALETEEDILRYVSENIGAIGFVQAEKLNPDQHSIKVIKIDGKDITDKVYPIR